MDNKVQFGFKDQALTDLIRSQFSGNIQPFKPIAYYDSGVDCICVYTRDRSVCEVYSLAPFKSNRTDTYCFLTLFKDNYTRPHEDEWIGFRLEPARSFCLDSNIPVGGPVILNQVLERLAILYPSEKEKILIAQSQLDRLDTATVFIP